MAAVALRGLNMSDLDDMTIGDAVDYCIAYNEITSESEREENRTRKATQNDWDTF